jgi:hypothetical protein
VGCTRCRRRGRLAALLVLGGYDSLLTRLSQPWAALGLARRWCWDWSQLVAAVLGLAHLPCWYSRWAGGATADLGDQTPPRRFGVLVLTVFVAESVGLTSDAGCTATRAAFFIAGADVY